MSKTKRINYLLYKIFISACVVVIFIFGLSAITIIINLELNNARVVPETSFSDDNSFNFNVVRGKILNIQDKIVFLETPAVDLEKQKLNESKKEIRKLTIDSKTEFFKQRFGLKKGKEKDGLESIVEKAVFEDLKIGDSANAVSSGNLAEIKDFFPITMIILPD